MHHARAQRAPAEKPACSSPRTRNVQRGGTSKRRAANGISRNEGHPPQPRRLVHSGSVRVHHNMRDSRASGRLRHGKHQSGGDVEIDGIVMVLFVQRRNGRPLRRAIVERGDFIETVTHAAHFRRKSTGTLVGQEIDPHPLLRGHAGKRHQVGIDSATRPIPHETGQKPSHRTRPPPPCAARGGRGASGRKPRGCAKPKTPSHTRQQ